MNIRFLNLRLNLRAIAAVMVVLTMNVWLLAATIKCKDGRIVKGQIRGMIVQKGEVELKTLDEGTQHIAHYHMSNGEDIEAIDEEGVQRSHVWLVQASAIGGLPDDLEVFKPGESTGALVERKSAKGLKYTVIVIDFKPRVASKEKLLGEVRTEHGKDVIVPALHVTTKEGVVEIPVTDIVAFKSEPKKKS